MQQSGRDLELEGRVLPAPEGDQLVVLHPPPVGGDTAERLALLEPAGSGPLATAR
ncbi:hypothetical protein AB0D97_23130 [Streptomyces roseus]|uniref:hypothetical protein n=1 Tax=Streptomyces roseus TaxID=66430 RepID=UPI0033E628EE